MTDIPGIGHGVGVMHYINGDNESGEKAMKASTRTIFVLAGAAAGTVVGGPWVGALGAINAGFAFDIVTTGKRQE